MKIDSEISLLKKICDYFESGNGDLTILIDDLGHIVQKTSMMMKDDEMWDYCVELSSDSNIWNILESIIKNIVRFNGKYNMNQLRIIKGLILMIRNLSITYGKLPDEFKTNYMELKHVRDLGIYLLKLYEETWDDDEIHLKVVDIAIVCFHCMFNFMKSCHEEEFVDLNADLELFNSIMVQLQNVGGVFEMKQLLPQFKAYCMIFECRKIIMDKDCLIFVNVLNALKRTLNFTVLTDVEDLERLHENEYNLLLMLAHTMVYLFENEKLGSTMYKLEKLDNNYEDQTVLLFLVACQMTFSITPEIEPKLESENTWKWDYLAIGAMCLDFFKIYREECSILLEDNEGCDSTKEKKLNILHRKVIAILDIVSNLLQYELFKKTLNSYEFLKDCIMFLKVIEDNTERKRLKDSEDVSKGKKKFPQAKTIIIEILTYLVHHDHSNQDKVREFGGLGLILNNCNLDVNEPFIRERCILCLKYLLENNLENQKFIGSLEAKGMEINKENEEILEKCGYEVDIVDGKVKLKRQTGVEDMINKSKDDKIEEI